MEQLGVHLIDVLVALLGEPTAFEGWQRNRTQGAASPEWIGVQATFPGEVRATVCTSFSSLPRLYMEFIFEKGYLTTNGKSIRLSRTGQRTMTIRPRGVEGGLAQFLEFADCVEQGRSPATGASEAATVMAIVESVHAGCGGSSR